LFIVETPFGLDRQLARHVLGGPEPQPDSAAKGVEPCLSWAPAARHYPG